MSIKKMLLGSAFYSVGNMVGAGLNMLFQFMLMMFLSFENYGIIQPLLQFVGLLLLPVSAYQFALTKHYSDISAEELKNESLNTANKINLICVIISLLWILMIPIFKKIFHVNDNIIFLLLLVSLLLNIFQVPYLCRLQAERKFFTAGIAQIIQGIVRITLGVLCVWILSNIWGALIGVIVSNIAFVICNIFEYRSELLKKQEHNFISKPFSLKLLFVSLSSVGLFSLLIYSDTVLVRVLLPNESALFASSNLLGKGMIFLVAGISFVILPIMSKKVHNSKQALWIGFLCLFILVLMYTGFFLITSTFIGQILFGKEIYILNNFKNFMPYYNMMFMPYPLIYYFLNYYLVQENFFYPYLLGLGVFSLYVSIFLHHSNIYIITNIVGIIGYSLLFIVILHAIFSKDKGAIHEEQIDENTIDNLI